ncbi:hypothetical protein [Flavobacterium fluviatile]|uniref:hypothetical protein n=1 Tax=Flavobacterium fluviatile TaxID=1862387 RepID=UPI0013D7DD9E|nr:hypothetical protein [Flavobacterium fluviatile]
MKKLLLLGMLFIGLNCFAQGTHVWKGQPGDGNSDPNYPATTAKEYNYLTKGLKIQLESGLDVIDGYELKDDGKIIVQNKYVFTFSNLIEKSTGDLKGVSVIMKSGGNTLTYYLCIPVNHLTYSNYYAQTISGFSTDQARAYSIALSEKYWKMDRAIINKNKKG